MAIDKLDKIGIDNVNKELFDKGLPQEAINALQPILHLSGTNTEKLDQLETILANSETGLKGIEELRTIFALYAASTQDGDLATYVRDVNTSSPFVPSGSTSPVLGSMISATNPRRVTNPPATSVPGDYFMHSDRHL